jgi:hypothetical protein
VSAVGESAEDADENVVEEDVSVGLMEFLLLKEPAAGEDGSALLVLSESVLDESFAISSVPRVILMRDFSCSEMTLCSLSQNFGRISNWDGKNIRECRDMSCAL